MMVLWNKSLQSDWSESCDKDELMSSSVLKWENKHFEIRFDALTVWWMRTLSLYILWCCQQGRFLLYVDCVGAEGPGATREPPQVASSFSISEEWPHRISVKSTWHLAFWLVRSALYQLVRSGVYCALLLWRPVLLARRGEASCSELPLPVVYCMASKRKYSSNSEKRRN